MPMPMRVESAIAYFVPVTARSIFPAPLFCATNDDIDCMNADGTSMMNAQTFSATPTAADAVTPSVFTMARITRNEMLTKKSCRAIGAPKRTIFDAMDCCRRILPGPNVKGRGRFRMRKNETMTLIAWETTVASAAPALPMPNPLTRRRSPKMLATAAIMTVMSGVVESPMPRKTAPSTL